MRILYSPHLYPVNYISNLILVHTLVNLFCFFVFLVLVENLIKTYLTKTQNLGFMESINFFTRLCMIIELILQYLWYSFYDLNLFKSCTSHGTSFSVNRAFFLLPFCVCPLFSCIYYIECVSAFVRKLSQ